MPIKNVHRLCGRCRIGHCYVQYRMTKQANGVYWRSMLSNQRAAVGFWRNLWCRREHHQAVRFRFSSTAYCASWQCAVLENPYETLTDWWCSLRHPEFFQMFVQQHTLLVRCSNVLLWRNSRHILMWIDGSCQDMLSPTFDWHRCVSRFSQFNRLNVP
jgi:hypothetical protein